MHLVVAHPGEHYDLLPMVELKRKERDTKMRRDGEAAHALLAVVLLGLYLSLADLHILGK